MRLKITDNAYKDGREGWSIKDCYCSEPPLEVAEQVKTDLFQIASKTLNELCEKNPNLLVFPHCLG